VGLGRAVGITDDAAQRGQVDDTSRDYDWENLSQGSGRRDTNLLRGGPVPEAELPQRGRGVGSALQSANNSVVSPTLRERYQPRGEGIGHIPRSFTQQDVVDVQSNVSLAGGYDQQGGGQGETGDAPDHRPQALRMGGGLARAIAEITQRQNDATLERELEWQARVGGDAVKVTAFKEHVLNQQALRAFAFMKGKSPAIHMAHSIGSFFGLSGLASDVQGKQIAFVGDRAQGRQPIPFILPPQNAWTWARVRYCAMALQ
jgi:hypothetical protein